MKKNTLGNLFVAGMMIVGTVVNAADVPVTADITTNTTWYKNNTYIIGQRIKVKNNATLTIEPGTVIKGDNNGTAFGSLTITRGAKIIAQGTASEPIVFTSAKATPARGDWGGIQILGKGITNQKDSAGAVVYPLLEGSQGDEDFRFGGSDDDDNSGVLSYVRIEYAGFVFTGGVEFNSLSLAAVGSGTQIDHIEIKYSLDDAIEIWGGAVDIKYWITYSTRDDDFDTDFGWKGKAQFGLIVRDPGVSDTDAGNAFESDNTADARSANTPHTSGTISNVTAVGVYETQTTALADSIKEANAGWGARIRRSSQQSIFNSIFLGWKKGLRIENDSTQKFATNGELQFVNNIIAGYKQRAHEAAFDSLYLANAVNKNTVSGGNANDYVKLNAPFAYYSSKSNYAPQSGSPALTKGSDFTSVKLSDSFFENVDFVGAFGTDVSWLNGWTSFADATTGIETAKAYINEVSLFPNPAANIANFVVNSKENVKGEIAIFDITGRMLTTQDAALTAGENTFTFNIADFTNGLYIVRLSNSDFAVSKFLSVAK